MIFAQSTDDAARFDLSIEIGNRIAFLGQANTVRNLEAVYRELLPLLPTNSAFVGILAPEQYTGHETDPPDKAFVQKCLYLLTAAPGLFISYDEAEAALRLCIHATVELWAQHRKNRDHHLNCNAAGVMTGTSIALMAAIFGAELTWGLLSVVPPILGLWRGRIYPVNEQTLAAQVQTRIEAMLKEGQEQVRRT